MNKIEPLKIASDIGLIIGFVGSVVLMSGIDMFDGQVGQSKSTFNPVMGLVVSGLGMAIMAKFGQDRDAGPIVRTFGGVLVNLGAIGFKDKTLEILKTFGIDEKDMVAGLGILSVVTGITVSMIAEYGREYSRVSE